jgi:hypothetical protein
MTQRHRSLIDILAVVAVALCAAVAVRHQQTSAELPATPVVLARNHPIRMTSAGGRLFWTTASRAFADQQRTLGRATSGTTFGAVAVDKSAYVVVNHPQRHASWISRLGPAAVVAASPGWIGERDLITDGTSLFWADEGGVRSVPPAGGPVRTLAATSSAGEIGADADRIYFADGRTIRSVAKDGGTMRTEIAAAHRIVAFSVRAGVVSWAESDGSVRQRAGRTEPVEYAEPIAGRAITDVTFDGRRLVWAYCWKACRLAQHLDGVTSSAGLAGPARDLVSEGISTVLICDGQVQRHTQLPPRPRFSF